MRDTSHSSYKSSIPYSSLTPRLRLTGDLHIVWLVEELKMGVTKYDIGVKACRVWRGRFPGIHILDTCIFSSVVKDNPHPSKDIPGDRAPLP